VTTVCLVSNTLNYPEGGGHLWVYLNWALGLRSCGCRVVWLEVPDERIAPANLAHCVARLKDHLAPYGFAESIAICTMKGEALGRELGQGCADLDAAAEADLAISVLHAAAPEIVRRFRRSALLDIDPGFLQSFIVQGLMRPAKYDLYFTIGETVGRPGARFPDAGIRWHYTKPCVALDWWPVHRAGEDASFTTVSHWYGGEWLKEGEEWHNNEKREAFLPFLDLPRHGSERLELALCLGGDERERKALESRGWRVREAWEVSATPWDYQRYVQQSRGEFSCAKPLYVRLQTAWISDRTLCYLASGKPAVVQHTGPSAFLPEAAGLFRFRTLEEARRSLETIHGDYERQCRLARAFAEEHFEAGKVVARLLERAL
jgi:hypothetical protein